MPKRRACSLAAVLAMLLAAGAQARPLEALVFLDNPKEVVHESPAPGLRIDAARVPALATPQAQKLLEPFIGMEIDRTLLDKLRGALQRYFISIRQPFVDITIPNQIASSGTLQVVALVSRLGHVRVEGNRWFDDRQYLGAMRLRPGEPIDPQVLTEDIAWINRNPYRHATPVASAGKQVGTTDLTLRARDQRPLAFNAGLDNTGTPASGRQRITVGLDWGNALWRGDDFNYSYVTDADRNRVEIHSLSYTANLPWRDQLTLSGTNSKTQSADPASPVRTNGDGRTAGLRYRHALEAVPGLEHALIAAFDYKRTNNDTLFGGASVFATDSDIDQFTLGYSASVENEGTRTSVDFSGISSPGGISSNNNTDAFEAQRLGANARYSFLRGTLDRIAQLSGRWSWEFRGTSQESDRNLLASEQFVLGGSHAVRGFEEFAAVRDNGYLITVELRAPAMATPLGAKAGGDQLVPFLFSDFGSGRNHDDLGGADSYVRLWSAGMGLRYQFGSSVSAQVSSGAVLGHAGLPTSSHGAIHFALQSSF